MSRGVACGPLISRLILAGPGLRAKKRGTTMCAYANNLYAGHGSTAVEMLLKMSAKAGS